MPLPTFTYSGRHSMVIQYIINTSSIHHPYISMIPADDEIGAYSRADKILRRSKLASRTSLDSTGSCISSSQTTKDNSNRSKKAKEDRVGDAVDSPIDNYTSGAAVSSPSTNADSLGFLISPRIIIISNCYL